MDEIQEAGDEDIDEPFVESEKQSCNNHKYFQYSRRCLMKYLKHKMI